MVFLAPLASAMFDCLSGIEHNRVTVLQTACAPFGFDTAFAIGVISLFVQKKLSAWLVSSLSLPACVELTYRRSYINYILTRIYRSIELIFLSKVK